MRAMKNLTEKVFLSFGGAVSRLGISANGLTLIGFSVSLLASWMLSKRVDYVSGILVFVVGFLDGLDGAVAKAAKSQSTLGAFLDSTLDRFSEGFIYLGMAIYFLTNQSPSTIILVYVVAINALIISYILARANSLGLTSDFSIFVRGTRLAVLSLGLILNQAVVTLWILAIGTGFTVFHRFISSIRAAKNGASLS